MSQPPSPWHRPAQPRAVDPRLRFAILIAAIALFSFALWKLSQAFPGRAASDMDHAYIIRGVAIVALVSSGLVYGRQIKLREALRNISIWTGIAAVLMLAYTYQDELRAIGLRVRGELVPSYAVETNPRELVLTADENGQFVVFGNIDGAPVRFLVDTGASDIVLSPADARRLGVDVDTLNFSRDYETANGAGKGAPFTLASLSVGPFRFTNVPVSINQAPMDSSLLGMPFLERLASFEIRGRRLTLRAR